MKDKLQDCIELKKTNYVPIWFMRQAGRYLPEFRKIREKNTDFIKLCLNENLTTKIFIQTSTIIYKKVNGVPLNHLDRKNITWHSDMDLVTNFFSVLKKLTIQVEVIFDDKFLPQKEHNRKKIALHCWKKINYNLRNSLCRK